MQDAAGSLNEGSRAKRPAALQVEPVVAVVVSELLTLLDVTHRQQLFALEDDVRLGRVVHVAQLVLAVHAVDAAVVVFDPQHVIAVIRVVVDLRALVGADHGVLRDLADREETSTVDAAVAHLEELLRLGGLGLRLGGSLRHGESVVDREGFAVS